MYVVFLGHDNHFVVEELVQKFFIGGLRENKFPSEMN